MEFIDLGEMEFHSPDGWLEWPRALQAGCGGCDSVWIYFPDTLEWEWTVCPSSCHTLSLTHPIAEAGRENQPFSILNVHSWVL